MKSFSNPDLAFYMHENWSQWRKSNYEFFEKTLRNLPTTSKLVDLGAGSLPFRDIFKHFEYTGVDWQKGPDIDIIGDLTQPISLGDGVADIVTISNTLEHIHNPLHVLKESARILKSGGLIVGTVPFLMGIHQAPYDFSRYTSYKINRLLMEAGFSSIVIFPLGQAMDVYNTIELKVFDELLHHGGKLIKIIRVWRRAEMRILRMMFSGIPANEKMSEGYGFTAKR